ncbi:MAG: hypothetical protein QOG96_2030, partial [Pseudonocardiales bacterium]|nr:hypothetical protein [Pseudonocardiales bacterium]
MTQTLPPRDAGLIGRGAEAAALESRISRLIITSSVLLSAVA